MIDPLRLASTLGAGTVLGAMFYGGLWWTVRRGVASKRAALWFCASLLLRVGAALAGLHFIAGADWQRLLLCLFGFILARLVVTWLTRRLDENTTPQALESSHAP